MSCFLYLANQLVIKHGILKTLTKFVAYLRLTFPNIFPTPFP